MVNTDLESVKVVSGVEVDFFGSLLAGFFVGGGGAFL